MEIKMKRFSLLLSSLTAAFLSVSARADDPVLDDVLKKEQSVFEIHISLPQVIIILLFIFCALCLIYFNFRPRFRYSKTESASKRRDGYIDEAPVIDEIEKTDPDFDAPTFREYAARVYSELRESICNKNLEDIRAYVSDDVVDQIQKNVDFYVSRGETKHYEKSNIYSVKIAKTVCENGIQTISVRIHVSFVEYVTNDASGKVVSGSKNERISRFYKLRFSRSEGVFSDVSYNLIKDTCPCCGAPLSVNGKGVCEYCGRDLNEGKYGFVLSSYERWKNRRAITEVSE